MKFLLMFYTIYEISSKIDWDMVATCEATDYVMVPAAYGSADAAKMATAINTLCSKRGSQTTNVWIGTPGVSSNNFNSGYTASGLTNFLSSVYTGLHEGNEDKIVGAYMNQESFYGDMDYTNPLGGSVPASTQLQKMKAVGDWVKAGHINGTKFLWIPYYGYGASAAKIIKDIGYAADYCDIFDYCILQPHYFFDAVTSVGNLAGVRDSVANGYVCYRDGVRACPVKNSGTEIGFEMEHDSGKMYGNDPSYMERYREYVSTFTPYKSKPYGFYVVNCSDAQTFDDVNSFM